MTESDDERQECDDFVQWAQDKTPTEYTPRLEALLAENSHARRVFEDSRYGDGIQKGRDDRPILTNHTGYQKPGSENWEHDDTGNEMNYSGAADDMLNAKAENEGWEPGYDYDRPPDEDTDISI